MAERTGARRAPTWPTAGGYAVGKAESLSVDRRVHPRDAPPPGLPF